MYRSNIDLHCHSLASDGALSPSDVVVRAVENGVTLLALTDHDTVEGQAEAMKQAHALNIEMVSGIELSCVWGSSLVHILGLNFSLSDGIMQEVQDKQSRARLLRAEIIADKLIKKGMPDLLESAKNLTQSGIPGRPHFSEAMISQGLVSDHKEAFKKYLGAGKAGDVKSSWPDLSEVLSWIYAAKGDSVIAHPRKYKMSQTKLRELMGDFKEEGGTGIEVVVSGQKQGEIGLMSDLCNRFELKGSVGSDFHTPEFPWANLGRIPSLPDSVEPIWQAWGLGA
jgi:predicted metal-dependent phosphoesterase TrpH